MRKLSVFIAFVCFLGTLNAQTAKYPAQVVTDTQLFVAKDLVTTQVSVAMGATDTTINVQSTSGMVPNMLFTVGSEKISVCAVPSPTTLTVGYNGVCPSVSGRGFDSTTATSHPQGSTFAALINDWFHNAMSAEVKAIETTLGPNLSNIGTATWGLIVGTLSAQTDLQTALNAKQNALGYTPENLANKNANSGYAGLDSGGHIITSLYSSTIPVNITGNSNTATAAAGAGTPCSTGFAPTGVDTSWNSIGCASISGGGGASAPLAVVRTSGTILTVGTCSGGSPCLVRIGASVFTFTSAPTVTLVSGSGTVYIYVDGASGAIIAGNSSGTTPSLTCSGCTVTGSITQFPAFSIPLATWTATTGTWASTGTDQRSILSGGAVIAAGAGISLSNVAGQTTVSFVQPSAQTYRTVCMIAGSDNAGSALGNSDIGPQGGQAFIPVAATIIEVEVKADAGTPTLLPRKEHGASNTSLLSGALATAASGAVACSNVGGTLGLDGVTTCAATLTTTALAAGDWLGVASGVAGGTAKRANVCVTYTVN